MKGTLNLSQALVLRAVSGRVLSLRSHIRFLEIGIAVPQLVLLTFSA